MFGWIAIAASVPVWLYFFYRLTVLFRFIRSGGPTQLNRTDRPMARLGRVLIEVFGHTHFKGRPLVNAAHWLVMVGFLFGAIVWFEAYIQTFAPDKGWPWLGDWPVYHFIEEVLAIGTVLGICFLIGVRLKLGHTDRGSRFYNSQVFPARLVEAIVFLEGLGMLAVKAAAIATYGGGSPWADFLTMRVAGVMQASPSMVQFFALVKLLTGLVFIACIAHYFQWGVMWHRFMAFFNIFFQRNADGEKALGALPTPDLEDLEPGSWKMLLDASSCTECGRCQDLCPAWNTDKPLSPKKLMMDLRQSALDNYNPHEGLNVLAMAGTIDDDVLWSCTNCGACVDQCPVDIEHIDHVADLRRFKVLAESDFPSELTGLFKNMETKGNPWGRNASERRAWIDEARADGIEVPIIGEDAADFSDLEYLFWVGCAGAYDDKGRATTRAVVDMLHTAGVKFGVLATGETCTGDPARRAGNEFLFQVMAEQNVATLNDAFAGVPKGQRKIITTCPHCFNTIRNEYPDFDGHFDVLHHTQLLNRLVREKLLVPVPRSPENRRPVTYHDPCFLGRHNKVFDPPRELVEATGASLAEMDHNRDAAFCCGAGGARMFMEENLGNRVNEFRSEQAVATGAEQIATGCPFCNVMLTGGVKSIAPQTQVSDVALMLRDAIAPTGELPAAREKAFLDTPRREPVPEKPASEEASSIPSTAPQAPAAPSAPQAPAAPSAPQAPSTPTAPSAASPTAPSAPQAPTTPQVAGAPTAPTAPSATKAPTAPPAPNAPGAPSANTPAPNAAAAPQAPANTPAAPQAPANAPAAPAAPQAPGAPSTPNAAAVPTAPAAPKATTTPNAPQAPAAPAAPAAPQAPTDTPSVPKAPTAPTAPSAPTAGSVPKAPAAPQAPAEGASESED
ncbi:4Fe-4S dicluster domain-containing protein [Corynebacterium aurimucosum]|uniref:(Fe-S)-binding protein n=1 Tax=Corynebacterium aurimucosum TaxID=169292 RepID=UPI001C0EB59A|nr:(Fe-S)-binding protein [Corynebacterium aurimucosum]MBU5654547.1 4Fe-4S dicluster domain-containing protein [Corynebacterium aurimucosum]